MEIRSIATTTKGVLMAAVLLVPVIASTADFAITASAQRELDRQKTVVAGWAANPVVVKAVLEQNRKGPLAGMDNATWKSKRRSDPIVKQFQSNPAGEFLRAQLRASAGAITEVFLNGAKGEKVAFVEKTTSYIHAGSAKHDVPLKTGRAWQGEPEFDESSQTYAVQISVPVVGGSGPIGSLVVGVNLSHLKSAAR